MIIHRHHDGSEGYEYQVGDLVIVERTIHGGWFDYGPTRADRCTIEKIDKRSNWRIAELDIHYSSDWGPASCFPWMVKPHADTLAAAEVVHVTAKPGGSDG